MSKAKTITPQRTAGGGMISWVEAKERLGGMNIDIRTAPVIEQKKILKSYMSRLGATEGKRLKQPGANLRACETCGTDRTCEKCVQRDEVRLTVAASKARAKPKKKFFSVFGQFDEMPSQKAIEAIAAATHDVCSLDGRDRVVVVFADGSMDISDNAHRIVFDVRENYRNEWPVVAFLRPATAAEVKQTILRLASNEMHERVVSES